MPITVTYSVNTRLIMGKALTQRTRMRLTQNGAANLWLELDQEASWAHIAIERFLSRIIVTPCFHTSHHVVDRQYGDAILSTIFSFWDPLFRSYNQVPRGPDGQLAEDAIGLPEARDLSLSFRAWFTEPFSRRNTGLRFT